MLERGDVYLRVAPTLWDVDFRMAVSQAELEDREQPSAYHRIAFRRVGAEGTIEIDTTRPELIASCVALVAHPDDVRFRPLVRTSLPAVRRRRPRSHSPPGRPRPRAPGLR